MSPSAYKAALTRPSLWSLKKLSENLKPRVLKAVGEILTNPSSGGRLKG